MKRKKTALSILFSTLSFLPITSSMAGTPGSVIDEDAAAAGGPLATVGGDLAVTGTSDLGDLSVNSVEMKPLFVRGGAKVDANGGADAYRKVYYNGVEEDSGGRGLELLVISRSTGMIISGPTNYDVYANSSAAVTAQNDLAAALNSRTIDEILVISSTNGWGFNDTLKDALLNIGASQNGLKLTNAAQGVVATPYALVGIRNLGEGNGLEAYSEDAVAAPYADISTMIISGSSTQPFTPIGLNHNDFLKNNGDAIFHGKIGIGTDSPARALEVNSGEADIVARFKSTDTHSDIELIDSSDERLRIRSQSGELLVQTNNDTLYNGSPVVLSTKNGNVGIGTATPSTTLEVNGDLKITGDIVSTTLSVTDNIDLNNNALISSDADNIGGTNVDYLFHRDNNYGFIGGVWNFVSDKSFNTDGSVAGNSLLKAGGIELDRYFGSTIGGQSSSYDNASIRIGSKASGHYMLMDENEIRHFATSTQGFSLGGENYISFYTGDASNSPSDSIERMRIKNDGKIGVGITNPVSKFHVANNVNSPTTVRITNINSGASAIAQLAGESDTAGVSIEAHSSTSNKNYGGSSNADSVVIRSWDGKPASSMVIGIPTDNAPLHFMTNNINRMTIDKDGDIGIGTTTPSEKLEVAGNIKATGTITASDRIELPGYTDAEPNGNKWVELTELLQGNDWQDHSEKFEIEVSGSWGGSSKTIYHVSGRFDVRVYKEEINGGANAHELKIYSDDNASNGSNQKYKVGFLLGNVSGNGAWTIAIKAFEHSRNQWVDAIVATEPTTGWTLVTPAIDDYIATKQGDLDVNGNVNVSGTITLQTHAGDIPMFGQ